MIPQPRTESHTEDSLGGRSPRHPVELPRFATSGEIAVDVTNDLDVEATVQLESNPLVDLTQRYNANQIAYPNRHPSKTAAPGETVTFDSDGLGSAGTFWRAVVEFDTTPSSGSVSVTYEQLNLTRRVHVNE